MTEPFVSLRRALPSSAHAGGFRLPLLLLALLGSVLPRAHAAIPAAAKNDVPYAKGYLVVSHYPGAFTNETSAATTTAGLNEAIADAYTNSRGGARARDDAHEVPRAQNSRLRIALATAPPRVFTCSFS